MQKKKSNTCSSDILTEPANTGQSHLSVFLDYNGKILEIPPGGYGMKNAYLYLRRLLLGSGNIRGVFELPDNIRLAALAEHPFTGAENKRFFNNRKGMLDFRGEQEECYSQISLAQLRLYSFSRQRIFGVITLAAFFNRVSENFGHPVFYLNAAGNLAGCNRLFFSLFKESRGNPDRVMGGNIRELMEPAPEQAQDSELERVSAAIGKGFRKVCGIESPDAIKSLIQDRKEQGLFLGLPRQIQWAEEDVAVKVTLEEKGTLPCLLLGDPFEAYGFPDRDGYLLGPGPGGTDLTLKKRGVTLHSAGIGPAAVGENEYCFFRIGNAFFIYRGHEKLFAFVYFNYMNRGMTHLLLYCRPGQAVRLKKIEISVRGSAVKEATRNIFTTLKNGSHRQYLIETLEHFPESEAHERFTIFKLQDFTDIRNRLETLQRECGAAAKKEEAARRLLQAYHLGRESFVGSGKTAALVREKAEKIAASGATVLIQGPTGSGKEVLARLIHSKSPNAHGEFVKVDCSTLPAPLMESLLFGHEKGAFTGADAARAGLFEQAEGGTLFLDEISNLSLEIQAKLLQFLQDRTITRVGGQRPLKLNLRILVASNIPLEEAVARKNFREDLYYRIAVVVLKLPSLSERPEDIPELLRHFILEFNGKTGKNIRGLAAEAYKKIYSYSWPGNIRELKNVVERAFIFCEEDEISAELIQLPGQGAAPMFQAGTGAKSRKAHTAIDKSTREIIALFRKHNGMVKSVARELGVTRQTLYNFLLKYGIRPDSLRQNPRKSE